MGHLLLLVNGLFGVPEHWSGIATALQDALKDDPGLLIVASKSNTRFRTYQGIDVCGERLVQELEALKAAHPGLQSISIIGHR